MVAVWTRWVIEGGFPLPTILPVNYCYMVKIPGFRGFFSFIARPFEFLNYFIPKTIPPFVMEGVGGQMGAC
jgi:hypothetical protein